MRRRRLGYHWWREYVTDVYRDARDAWEALRESELCYQLEDDEFRVTYPPPTFKLYLLALAGTERMAA